jgi:hypothetical protein
LHDCQTLEEFRIIFGCMCKRYLDQLRKKRNVDRRNFGLINYLNSAMYSAICELETGIVIPNKSCKKPYNGYLGHAAQGTQSIFENKNKSMTSDQFRRANEITKQQFQITDKEELAEKKRQVVH